MTEIHSLKVLTFIILVFLNDILKFATGLSRKVLTGSQYDRGIEQNKASLLYLYRNRVGTKVHTYSVVVKYPAKYLPLIDRMFLYKSQTGSKFVI